MERRRAEWILALLSIGAAIVTMLASAALIPYDPRGPMLAAAFMSFSLWLVIGLYPRDD
ncbi:hypothetical protein [Sphingosinicella sp. BN140058]|uniref:hypothetical protein n=1 Tax=Sphingosinicella sp. BN140058 TaxID=1892855 RepID=UPI0013E9A8C4|nr:hypothetical protein [Sphingosinicella sp. BN140058]